MATPRRALRGLRATAPTDHPIKEDSDFGHLLLSDSVHCDNISSNVSCLNVHAPLYFNLCQFLMTVFCHVLALRGGPVPGGKGRLVLIGQASA